MYGVSGDDQTIATSPPQTHTLRTSMVVPGQILTERVMLKSPLLHMIFVNKILYFLFTNFISAQITTSI